MGEGNVLTRVCPSVCPQGGRGGQWGGGVGQPGGRGVSHGGGGSAVGGRGGSAGGRGGSVGGRGGSAMGGKVGQVQPGGRGGSGPAGGRGGSGPAMGGGRGGSGPAGGGGSAKIAQHRKYLLHGRRYASCVHAGGLSCCLRFGNDLVMMQLSSKTPVLGRNL